LPITFAWLRGAWVALSGAIALGALWSYNTLGWGGLWAWDPVETAVLITWIVVTAALHALGNLRRRGQNALLAPSLVGLGFPAVLFARFITQSGTSPLHSFGGGTSSMVGGLLVVGLVVSLGPPLFLWASGRSIGKPLEGRLFAPGTVLYLSVLLLCLLGIVFTWGIGLPIVGAILDARTTVGVDFYNLWGYPFAIFGLLLIGFYHQATANGRRALPVLGGVVLLTLLAAVVPVEGWTIAPDRDGVIFGALGAANFLVFGPPAAYAVLGLAESLSRKWSRLAAADERIALVGRTLVHGGLILVLLAGPFTYLFASSAAGFVPAASHAGGPVPVADSEYSLALTDYQQSHRSAGDELSAREKRALREAITPVTVSPAAVEGQDRSNAVVRGIVTDREVSEDVRAAQLNDTSVWVSVRTTSDATLQPGTTLWAQGPINGSENGTWIEAGGAFVGPSVTDAVVPAERLVTRSSAMTVYRNGVAIDSGRLGIDRYLGHGTFSSPHVHQGLLGDTYVVAQEYRSIQGLPVFYVLVKEVPLVNAVRLGIATLLLGGFLLLGFDGGASQTT
jgi:cytochrome c-type biogenesis protein CcmF